MQLFFAYPGLFNLHENPFATTHSAAQFCPFTNLYFTNSTVLFVNTCPLGASPWMISACDSLVKLRVHGVKHRGVPCCSSRITTMRSFRCFRSLFFSLSSEFQYMAFHVLSSSLFVVFLLSLTVALDCWVCCSCVINVLRCCHTSVPFPLLRCMHILSFATCHRFSCLLLLVRVQCQHNYLCLCPVFLSVLFL